MCSTAISQIDITLGTGTATNTSNSGTATDYPCPLQDYYEGSRAQFLFRAAELKTAGMDSGKIYSISFNVTNLNGFSGAVDSLKVFIGHTATTTLNATSWVAGANQQVYGAVNYVPTLGINTLTFTTPFNWNGTSNLLLEICNGDPNNSSGVFYSQNVSITQSTTAFNSSHTYRADDLGSLCGSTTTTNTGTQTLRPNFIFSWLPKLLCSGTPTIGAASATPSNVCFGQNVTLTVAGVPVASGLTYEWQSSNSASGPFVAIPGGTTKTFVTTQSANTWYQIKIVCTNTNDSVYSNIVAVTTPTLLGGVYTIDKTLPASATNFISFNAAYNAMKCGIISPVVFNVANGPYVEQLIVNGKIPGSSPTNTITFNGNGNVIQFSSTNTNERAVLKLKGTKYFIFDSLKVDASIGTYGIGFHLTNNADSNIIRNCSIFSSITNTTAGSTAGIAISGTDNNAVGLGATLCDNNTIVNNTISGGYYGITQTADFAGGANGGNIITGNTIKDFYRYGIYTNGSYNCIVDHNKISRPTRVTLGAFDGIYFTGQSNNAHVFRNRIFSPFKAIPTNNSAAIGINLDNASASATNDYLIDNNLLYDFVHVGAQVGINNNGSANIQIIHNTISLDDDASTGATTCRGYSQTGNTAVSVVFGDNLITVSRGGAGTKHCIYLASGTVLPVFADNNDYYMDAASGNNYIGFWTTNRLTLADWQTATGLDATSISIQPVYYQPLPANDTSNYHPTNAAMDNHGINLGIPSTYDLDSLTRDPNTPDIGAFEFVPPPCVPGSLNGVTQIRVFNKLIAGDTTVCENTPVKLSVKVVGPYGSAQTFQWERVKNLANTPDTFGAPMLLPDTLFNTNDTSYYYRCKISCLGVDFFTDWRLLSSISSMPAGDYSINSSFGPGLTNYIAGVSGATFKTYDTAVKAMRYCGIKGTGDVIFTVVPTTGPYVEQVRIDSVSGANVNRQVRFKGSNTTLQFPAGAPTASNDRAVIKLTRADFINFDSIVIDASAGATYGYGVQLVNNADSNTVTNCTISANATATSQNFAGIVVNATDAGVIATGNTLCDGNIFASNTITGGFYGVTLVGSAAIPVDANLVSKNNISDFYNSGVYLAGATNTIIDGNTFSRPTRTSVGVGTGVSLTNVVSLTTTISNNRFTNFYGGQPTGATGTYGISINSIDATPGNENIVFNNAFYNLNGLGFAYALYNNGSDNVFYHHNSISLDNPTISPTGIGAGFYQTVTALGIQFKNNIVNVTRGGIAAKYCINLNTAASATGFETNNNVLYIDGAVTNGHVGYLSTNKTTFASWQNAQAPKFDSLSFNYDPLFTDITTGDLKPQFYVIDNKGQNLGIPTDILGVNRNDPPDIGAWEFTAATCPTPLLAGTATVTPSSGLCLEAPIRLNLTGNSPVGQINFQWQDSIAGGTWQNLGPVKYSPIYDTITSVRNYYRCIVTCAATGATTTSTVAVETLNPLLPPGTYTIDSSKVTDPSPHTAGDNFQTFADAVTAMQCGILGSVVFDVKKGTFNEQVRIPYVSGASATKTITFQGSGGVATDKILTYANADAVNNYVLRFDSSNYVTFKDLTIENTNPTYGRVIDFVVRASNDRVLNCIVKTPLTSLTANTQSAIFSSPTKGTDLTIKGNTITGGANGIYFAGTSGSLTNVVANYGHLIDSNNITAQYGAGIFVQFSLGLQVSRNHITYDNIAANATAGIYANYCDSGFNLVNNRIDINNTNAAIEGIHIQNTANGTKAGICLVNGNEVYVGNANTGKVNGIYITSSNYVDVKNNVIAINSGDSMATYGLVGLNNTGTVTYYNNSINITAPGTKTAAAQLTQSSTGTYKLTNNIFSNIGGGRAMFQSNSANFTSDYNMLYTTGANLVVAAAVNYPTLASWVKASSRDKWSIVYPPAFISNQDLRPDIANENSWAMQGRAIQIKGNITDINGNYRPDSLQIGVPDLGAYEFFPSVKPPILPSIPAIPTANTEQTFYFGSDTVMRVRWDATPPPTAEVRRYSGVVGQYISNQGHDDSMYYYVIVDVPGNFAIGKMKLYYIDPWLGSIPKVASEYQLGIAQTDVNNTWKVSCTSRNDVRKKLLYDSTAVNYFSKFTGLYNPCVPPPPLCSDTSNVGTEFWLAYPANQLAGGETFQLYLGTSEDPAYVTVSVPSLNWVRTYNILPNTVLVSDILPQAARHQASGLYCDAIHIESDVPISAYAHCWGSTSSGATMLMPTCTWGYDYKMLGFHQDWGGFSYSSYFVVAKEDNTKIAIDNTTTPSGGIPTSTTVVLNKGCWYQVLAASSTADLSGSYVRSISNDQGKCLPFAFFSGDTRTLNSKPCGGGGDFAISQNFPSSAWGKRYLTAPTSRSSSAGEYQANLFRIALKDAGQIVKVNGTQIYPGPPGAPVGGFVGFNVSATTIPGTLIPAYLEFLLDSASCIESTKPIMVCQFLSGACTGNGDPDMAFISPMEQGINKTSFYTNTVETITANVLTLIGSTNDTPLICEAINGGTCNPVTWSKKYNHPCMPGKSVYIKHWPTSAKRQVTVSGDSIFTAITYGLGSVESYMYNAGTNILSYFPVTPPPCNKGAIECPSYTCAGTNFSIKTSISTIYPDSILFFTSNIAGISPNQNFTLKKPYNPPPTFSVKPNGDTVWTFSLQNYFVIPQSGNYTLRMKMWSPEIEGCDKSVEWDQKIQVLPSPKIDFVFSPTVICPNTNVTFTAGTMDANSGQLVKTWSWISNPYGINTGVQTSNTTSFFYGNAGTDTVQLNVRTGDFCVGDTSHLVTVNPTPVVTVVSDSLHVCSGNTATVNISSPLSGALYSVYSAATGGTLITTGNGSTPFSFPNITTDTSFYIECVSASGCVSIDRKKVKVTATQFPIATATQASITTCIGTSATFNVASPVTNAVYTWYDAATGGNVVGSGNALTISPVTVDATYYLETSLNGCVSVNRFPVALTAATTPSLAVVSNAVTVCSGDPANFAIASPDATVTYNWYTASTGGTATTGTTYSINPATTSASYYVSATSVNGCTTSPRLKVDLTVTQRPVVSVVAPSDVSVCKGTTQVFTVQNPVTGAVYNWYNAASSGTPLQANSITFTTPAVNAPATYYVDGTSNGCTSISRATVKVSPLDVLAPVVFVTVDSTKTNEITFGWSPVTGAVSYAISIDGAGYVSPNNIPTSLNHTLQNLAPGERHKATVMAIGANVCQNSISDTAYGKTVQNSTYYPNSFTPNGDGKNDKIVICGSSIKELRYAVFNQFGEKIWETTTANIDAKGCYTLWDGTQRGVPQPTGVYMYASRIVFLDGKVEEKNGSINLVR